MTFPYSTISKPLTEAGDDHQIIVVGSGYGGGVAASRLARTGQQVTLLERGREIAPGDYPKSMSKGMGEFRVTTKQLKEPLGNPDGLYDIHVGDDISVFVGRGLGGTSLINANVAIKPDARVFETWPEPFKSTPEILNDHYDRAMKVLGSKPYPKEKTLPKLDALEKVAKGLDAPFVRPDINVMFKDGYNQQGVYQAACNNCGDCVSGCNYGAKNTTLMNYLPDAANNGAKIYTNAEVRHIRKHKDGKRWVVTVRDTRPDATAADRELTAEIVILAAGTLGSTEILKRSANTESPEGTLSLSSMLGQRFTGNGDVWAFGYNANMPGPDGERLPVYSVGAGDRIVQQGPTTLENAPYKPGPCITGMVDLRDPQRPLNEGLVIEEGVMPGALAAGYAVSIPMLGALMGDPFRFGDIDKRAMDIKEAGETLQSDPLNAEAGAYTGPVSRTIAYLVMSHDAADGELELSNGHITPNWPDAGLDPAIVNDAEVLKRASDAIQAEFMPMPLWQDALGNRLIAVHPMGGCIMAEGPDTGVVNSDCQVFDPNGTVHDGLYVCDGAVIPNGLGVNPHLTITAVAEYAIERLADSKGWNIGKGVAPHPDKRDDAPQIPAAVDTRLKDAIEGIRQLKSAIDGRAYELAAMLLAGFWRTVRDTSHVKLPPLWRIMCDLSGKQALREVVHPIMVQFLEVLEPIEKSLEKKDFAGLLDHLEESMGDFSPSAEFRERMTGHLSVVGLNDTHDPHDPFLAAAQGPIDSELTARIHTDKISTGITPPKGTIKISDGLVKCPVLDQDYTFEGEFRLLMPDPDQIERWEMTYEGPLSPTNGGGKRNLSFKGFKTLQRREGSHWWRDVTELRTEILEDGEPIARGMLTLKFDDLLEQANGLTVAYSEQDLEKTSSETLSKLIDTYKKHLQDLPDLFKDHAFRANVVKTVLWAMYNKEPTDPKDRKSDAQKGLEFLYSSKVAARFGTLIARSYGEFFAYMLNFPHVEKAPSIALDELPMPEVYHPETAPNQYLKLTRYRKKESPKGPIIVGGGFGTKASSYAMTTVKQNFTQALLEEGYDVWLFDYRGSGDIAASLEPFTLDDVATQDWPTALELVCNVAKVEDVPIVVHCMASVSLFMAILRDADGDKVRNRVRSVISSQIAAHGLTNWFKFAQADMKLANAFVYGAPKELFGVIDMMFKDQEDVQKLLKEGIKVIAPCSPSNFELFERLLSKTPSDVENHEEIDKERWSNLNNAFDGTVYNVPSFAPVPCNSPTCHRITFIFGPSYQHDQLNQATHNAIADVFGPVSTRPFLHMAKIFREGHLVSDDGSFDYMAHPERIDMPVHFISGSRNQEMLPESTMRTWHWLTSNELSEESKFTREIFADYGHMDTFIGKNAWEEVFPRLIARLRKWE